MPKQIEGEDLEKLIAEAKGEHAAADAASKVEDLDDEDDENVASTDTEQGVPSWVTLPPNFSFPPGWLVWFIRFPAKYTNKPGGLDRICVCWNLSEADEKRATKRARGEGLRIIDEMAKQMIRCADGKRISLAPEDAKIEDGNVSLSAFWNEIGGKCRQQLKSLYLKTHVMDATENADFFQHCVAPRTVG